MHYRVTAVILPLDPSLFFLSILTAGSPHARSTVVTAVKFTIADQPQPIDALLKGCIGRAVTWECERLGVTAALGFFTPM